MNQHSSSDLAEQHNVIHNSVDLLPVAFIHFYFDFFFKVRMSKKSWCELGIAM